MVKSNLQVKIYDCETNQEIIRDATADEIAEFQVAQANFKAKLDAEAEKAIQRQAVADRLGLTADELKLLLG
jgi:hypothetical protein